MVKLCGHCSNKIQNRDKHIKCDLCSDLIHQICSGVSTTTQEELAKVEGLKWYCSNCRKVLDSLLLNIDVIKLFEKRLAKLEEKTEKKFEQVEEELREQKEKMVEIEEDLQQNEEKVNTKNDEIKQSIEAIENSYATATANGNMRAGDRNKTRDQATRAIAGGPVAETWDEDVQIIDDEEERKRSVIIHHMDESNDEDTGVRVEYDTNKVVEICKYLGNHEFNEHSIEKIFRLGKREAGKTRPLKVCLDGNITKFKIIRNTHKLKDSEYDGISIQHDLTKEQRKELKELIDLAKKKEQEDPTGNYIYKVRGPPGRKHIKRFRKIVVETVEADQDPSTPETVQEVEEEG